MEQIYKTKGYLDKSCSYSHITYTTHTEKIYSNISMEFKYTKNFITDDKLNEKIIQETILRDLSGDFDNKEVELITKNWEEFGKIGNLLTLSLYDEKGFRGASHRGSESLVICVGENETTEGYINGVLPIGKLEFIINAHSICFDCEYELIVYGNKF